MQSPKEKRLLFRHGCHGPIMCFCRLAEKLVFNTFYTERESRLC